MTALESKLHNAWRLWARERERGPLWPVAVLAPSVSSEHVQIIAHLIADDTRKPLTIQAPGQARPNPCGSPMPSATWRLAIEVTEATKRRGIGAERQLLADIYAPATRSLVERVARVFADAADMPVSIERAPFRNPRRGSRTAWRIEYQKPGEPWRTWDDGHESRTLARAAEVALHSDPIARGWQTRIASYRTAKRASGKRHNPTLPLVQLNQHGRRQWVLAWGDRKRYGEARHYANRTQAALALEKLEDPAAFEVWRPRPDGRVFYLRVKSQPQPAPASRNPRLWRSKIHRAGLGGGTACGTPGYVSTSGTGITCDKCLALERAPSREEVLQSIRDAAERFRKGRPNPKRLGPFLTFEIRRNVERDGYVLPDTTNDPGAFWTVYGRGADGLAVVLQDFDTEAEAIAEKERRERMAANPRELEAGEAVFVPYVGRSTKRTSERATVLGQEGGNVVVEVRKGKRVETRTLPLEDVRRAPARGPAAYRERVRAAQDRLELKELRRRAKEAREGAARERRASDCANAKAMQLQPRGPGEKPSREYRRELAAVKRHQVKAEALARIAHELEREDPAYADPWATPNPRPRLSWHTWGGGTGAWPGANAYSAIAPWGTYYVDPITTQTGRRAGYLVRLSVERPDQAPAGLVGPGLWHQLARASSPNEGKKVARLHYERGLDMQSRVDNPRGELRDAVRTFERWHEFKPGSLDTINGPPREMPRTLVKLGELAEVAYVSDKYTGKPVEYVHRFEEPLPVLATDPKGKHLHVVGGAFRITSDGLVG